MKILHVVPYFPPDRIGGVGEVVAHIHRALIEAGHTSQVVTVGSSLGEPGVERIAKTPLGWTIKVAGWASRARDFDVVHLHHGEALGLAIAMRLRRVQTPVLVTYHVAFREFARAHRPYSIRGRRFGRSFKNWRYRTLTCSMHRFMDRAIAPLAGATSFIARQTALDLLGPVDGASARLIYNGVPSLEAYPKVQPPVREGMLYVGNSGDRKRIAILPFVLADVCRERPETELRIVGVEAHEVPHVAELFAELGVSGNVRWIGRLRSEEITEWYASAAVVIVPSAAEGLPMVILEAFRAGAPCVATRVAGHAEAVEDGVNGYLVALDEPGSMARRCLELLGDPVRASRMGEVGRQLVDRQFSISRQTEEYLSLYGQMCAPTTT